MRKFLALAAALWGLTTAVAQGAALQIDGNGKLTGATGINVLGNTYDVRFDDGTCMALFGGCDDPGDFVFGTQAAAQAASDALLAQVFVGAFDTDPSLTSFVAPGTQYASVVTPYALALGRIKIVFAQHSVDELFDYSLASEIGQTTNLLQYGADIFAIWSPGNGDARNDQRIPEPGSGLLLLSGILLATLCINRQQRRRGAANGQR